MLSGSTLLRHLAQFYCAIYKRLKELEDENRRLKQMYAELCLDNRILKDIVEKKL